MSIQRPRLAKKLALLAIATLAALLLLEVAFRIVNPFGNRLRGNVILLPVQKRFEWTNTTNAKLAPKIVHTRNSLGFRGPNPPADFADQLTLVAVGGSTTECLLLGDGESWPEVLARDLAARFPRSWVNNAGLDGHSTFGHALLVDQHLRELKPDFCLYLVGVNEIGRLDLSSFDASLDASRKGFWQWLLGQSELVSLVRAFARTARAHALGVDHRHDDLRSIPDREVPEAERTKLLEFHRTTCVPAYRDRLIRLLQLTRSIPSEPILLTQPALYGSVVDPTTGIALGQRSVDADYMDGAGVRHGNGAVSWEILELYNDVTREVARATNTELIELAQAMPKDSAFYYDWVHYTSRGAEMVAKIVGERLTQVLRARGHGR